MAQSVFIRTTAFGGFDKSDVDKVFKELNTQIFALQNELRENRLILSGSESGEDADKIKDDIVSENRAKLSEAQSENETLKKNIEGLSYEVEEKNKTINSLNEQIDELKKKLYEADKKIESLSGGGSAALSKVFIEAQKSADMLVSDSQKQADAIMSDAKKLVENMVTEANNKASEIVYNAEKKAAETETKAKNSSSALEASSVNIRAAMLETVKGLSEEIANIKKVLDSFEKNGMEELIKSEKLLAKTENTLTEGGIPHFTEVHTMQANIPEPPKLVQPDYNYESVKPKANEQLDSDLNKLMEMAQSISDDNSASAPSEAPAADGELDLDSLLKQAESL